MTVVIVTTRQQFREYVQKYFWPSLTEDDKYLHHLTEVLNGWVYFQNHIMTCELREVKSSILEYTK